MFSFMKSTRSIVVVVFSFGIFTALLLGKITGEQFMAVASIPFVAYFAKRDEK